MSRHRNVRSIRYSDEYDGYDDVYGHSVEDDYSISPSDAAFMYDRSNQQQQLSSYVRTEEDIAEEDEGLIKENLSNNLNDLDSAKLLSCLDELRNVLGDSMPEQLLVEACLQSQFDSAIAIDKLLNSTSSQPKKQVIEAPKPQRTNAQLHGRGETPEPGFKTSPLKDSLTEQCYLGAGDCIHANLECLRFFDVEKFLSQDKENIDVNLLDALIIKKTQDKPTENKTACVEQHVVDTLILSNETPKVSEIPVNMFLIRHMPVSELKKERPSMFGYFVCKKLNEFNSNAIIQVAVTSTTDKIIPFDFNCKSPDDIALSNRRWRM